MGEKKGKQLIVVLKISMFRPMFTKPKRILQPLGRLV